MKTDSLFYRLFQEFPDIFFELIGTTPEIASNYQFSSVEVKQTAFRIDGVFLPNQEGDRIYFVEVQFQPQQEFYSRFLAEIFLYLRQNKPENDWSAIVLYPSSSTDAANIKHYREFFDSGRIRRIYLNELSSDVFDNSIAIKTLKLIIAPESKTVEQARELVDRFRQQGNQLQQEKFVQLVETILVYKLPNMSREEIEAMFELSDLKQTKVYQEAKLEGIVEGIVEGKLQSVPRFLALGLTVEQIAQALGLSVQQVRQAAENQTPE